MRFRYLIIVLLAVFLFLIIVYFALPTKQSSLEKPLIYTPIVRFPTQTPTPTPTIDATSDLEIEIEKLTPDDFSADINRLSQEASIL